MGDDATLLRATLNRLRRVRIPRWVWFTLLFLFAGGTGLAVGAWRNLCADCPSIAQIYTYEPRQTSKIYARDSTLVQEIGLERRTPVALASLPPHVPQAFIAIEDRRFYSHGGLDWKGIARAGLEVLRTRSLSGAGGSTITQQLARNMFTDRIGFEKRVLRKLKEWQVALALEEAYSKDQIIEAYMNQIGYAHGWYGLQTASRNYFGKNAIDMNPAEGALLAAIANRPERYSPLNDPDAAIGTQKSGARPHGAGGIPDRSEEAERWKEEPVPRRACAGMSPFRRPISSSGSAEDPGRSFREQALHRRPEGLYDPRSGDAGGGPGGHGGGVGADRGERPGFRHPTYQEFSEAEGHVQHYRDPVRAGDVRRDRPGDGPRAGHDRGARLRALQVQPGHRRPAAGRVILQAVRVRDGAGRAGFRLPRSSWTHRSSRNSPTARCGSPAITKRSSWGHVTIRHAFRKSHQHGCDQAGEDGRDGIGGPGSPAASGSGRRSSRIRRARSGRRR